MALHGVDIDPSAVIGDIHLIHTVGVVIGATSIIEDGCWIWSGVVLGGRGGSTDNDGNPVIRGGAAICAGAKVLGPVQVGERATVGANAVVLDDVPPGATVVGIPAVIVGTNERRGADAEMNQSERHTPGEAGIPLSS
jgi:serine O-acetyltransferase